MNNKKKIIVKINFNNWNGTEERLNKEWIDYRISIFINYTLKSLKLQTNQDFLALVLYDKATTDLIKQALACYDPLPENVKFLTPVESETRVVESIKSYDYLYYTFLASDDMFHKWYFQLLNEYRHKEESVVIIPQYGYAYDSLQNRLTNFFFYAPSFCTLIYKVEDYLQGTRHKLEGGWTGIFKHPREIIKYPSWINHIHSCNTGITFEKVLSWRHKGIINAWDVEPNTDGKGLKAVSWPEITDKEEINKILGEFF